MDAERSAYCDLIRGDLIGPAKGGDEILPERPDKRYLMGMLFPQDAAVQNALVEEEDEGEDSRASREGEDAPESPTDLLFQRLPSSVGLSFAVQGAGNVDLAIEIACGRYDKVGAVWKRREMRQSISLSVGIGSSDQKVVLEEGGRVLAIMRPGARGARVVTVSLINACRLESPEAMIDPKDILYQVTMTVRPSDRLARWPAPERLSPDDEEDELLLRYRYRTAFAIGHGCAANWSVGVSSDMAMIEFLPATTVPPVTTEIDLSGFPEALAVQNIQRLQSDETSVQSLTGGLTALVSAYRAWREGLDGKSDFDSSLKPAKDRILARIDSAIRRMDAGITLLRSDAGALQCFRLANRAMLMQMAYASRVADVEQKGRVPDPKGVPNPDDSDHAHRTWRPFQLAFFLMSLPGLWDEGSSDRDLVDLIWFPTGGGKTEAYLAAAAFEMLRRRMQLGERGGGTAVITRYTLRLLTQQQFQRSAHLICALEDLRAVHRSLGEEPFSLGLWIGKQSTPLRLKDANQDFLSKVVNPSGVSASNPFALLSCPCCGSALVPRSKQELSSEGVGIASTPRSFSFFCPDARCHRHGGIPVQVIDEALYLSPPTMLLGTLDKFAMLAWRDEASSFFGRVDGGDRFAPPSLIIQDELHLISGPLGTIAGVYEAAIDTVIASRGGHAKVIASTATIRRASEQAAALFAKSVEIFPPPGLDASDSFFSTDAEGEGRLYVGAMGQGHTPTYSVVMTSATMMQSVQGLGFEPEKADAWWTLVAYHNSRRELGKSLTMANDDIPARLSALYGRGARRVRHIKELSANVPGPEIPQVLDELKQGVTTGRAVDFLGCTNMLSVGVDVARLGLMLVVGQPRSTSEYIQATSRVGRDHKRLPGIVLTLFMPTKPRDRSHYEGFTAFHEAMYRYVEPTSVTPYALPARKRALHAAVVIAVRHGLSVLAANDSAQGISRFPTEVDHLIGLLEQRMTTADRRELAGIRRDLAGFMAEWRDRATNPGLRYSAGRNVNNFRSLIRDFGDSSDPDARETLRSMRHVDRSVPAKLFGQRQSVDAAPPQARRHARAARGRNP